MESLVEAGARQARSLRQVADGSGRIKTVGLTVDVAETYAPLNISVAYAGQTPVPKPFLMIVTWVRTPDGWKMATDVALPIPPPPAGRN
jgi:hypothetical protein